MIFKEFGDKKLNTIFLLHGGGLSWWNYREEAERLKNDFHIILPILDGHAGSVRPFTSIEDNAEEIISFINERYNGSVSMICGLSLGGQILLEILARKGDICRHALVESAMAFPSPITSALVGPAFECSYPLIRNRRFAELQFKQLRIKAELFDDYYRDTCLISKRDMIAFMKASSSYQVKYEIKNCSADVHIFYGERENHGVKKSAKIIRGAIPASSLTELTDMYHGEFSINHSQAYAEAIYNIINSDSSDLTGDI